jgi:hypothetical protein
MVRKLQQFVQGTIERERRENEKENVWPLTVKG